MKSMEHRLSSVAVILENPVGQALIVKANYKSYWSFPGGVIDKGETPKEAAIREVREEVGLDISTDNLLFVAVVDRKSDDAHTYQFIFRASINTSAIPRIVLQSSELEDFALVTKDEIASDNRPYGKVIHHWVNGASGYIEQAFNRRQDG
jgi:8-oxo-dGTP diphosphatase